MSSTDSASAPTKPVRIETVAELDALVDEHDRVLLDIYTKGCTLCQSIEPVLGNVAKATDVVVAMINPQTDMAVAEQYTIRSVPTLLLFEDGALVDRLADGFQGAQAIVDFVERPE
ncbi:thioredoxin [Haloferax mediterranei ATCC 33500]|uniref:Thioredoxin n=1 Tax=Haloferax mediterranei (strain ATCC 33500 / DSM 1411 / JCM 8866 / NBRC 14739 / NCIMB 2177 / R-4) TaxID=523841 RepID=I3R8B0_HALMT|nr:thioredoxin family protein [Haloferax mediterranei]AFK20470.1 thioredoxin [Haloferax mediterranei ATCC 33500]AHZ23832.1 thioredoxin [Haloferax mediterranei ATCC 33500]ELZ98255.1 thioredoxin [Haloferax mediterranei ATCC 33500]MDX5986773.1 thioredoxin family protein [Haloferax mediterranei ATCC 33500]QCQ76098.1 thioredoxin [Haloferax mediterranei ATCC 33500]